MNIIQKLKNIKSKLDKKQHFNFEKSKPFIEKLIKDLYNKNIIDDAGYKKLMDKVNEYKSNTHLKHAKISSTAMKNYVIVVILFTIIGTMISKSIDDKYAEQRNKKMPVKQEVVQQVQQKKQEEIKPQQKTIVKKTIQPQQVDQSDVCEQAFKFIKGLEDIIIGDVVQDGRVIARNVALVYDDKLKNGNPDKVWNGDPSDLDDFIAGCIGKPTIGYGTTDDSVVSKGYISIQEAQRLCKDYIRKVERIIIRRLGKQYWQTLNKNQKIAMLSYFYNCGPGAKADKQFAAIKRKDWKQAARQMDIVKSDGKVMSGLVKRRAIQQRLFLKGIK